MFQFILGEIEDLFGVAESTASVIFNQVCKILVSTLYDRCVYLPSNRAKWKHELDSFLENWEFPCLCQHKVKSKGSESQLIHIMDNFYCIWYCWSWELFGVTSHSEANFLAYVPSCEAPFFYMHLP